MKQWFVALQLVSILLCLNSEQVDLDPELFKKLIERTFNGYHCLNIYLRQTVQLQPTVIFREIHRLNYSFLLLDSLDEANQDCGFILVDNNIENFHILGNLTFNVNIRVMHIGKSVNDALIAFENEPILFEDKDVLLAELPGNISIQVKSRYDTDFKPVSIHVQTYFFHEKNHNPVTLNFNRQIVRVVTFNCPLFGSLNNASTELLDGVETRIFKEITQKLNLTTQVVVPIDNQRWGTAYPNGTITGGLIKYLFTRQADIGFCSVWVEISKFPYLAFSTYWNTACVKFFVPKPKRIPTQWSSVFKPLPETLWILVLVAVLITTTVCVALEYTSNRLLLQTWEGPNITYAILTILGSLVLAHNPTKHYVDSAHHHLLLWWSIFALMATNLYSSSLVSHLTYPKFEPMADTIESMVKAGYYWGTPYNPNSGQIFDLSNPWHVKFVDRYIYENSREDRLKRLLAGNYSLYVKCAGDKSYMEVDNLPSDLLHDLRTVRGCMKYFVLSFAYRKRLPYAPAVDRIISRLVESGITIYWMNRVFEQKYSPTTFEKLYEYKTPPEDIELTPLNVRSLQGAFILLVAGVVLAAVAFVGELVRGQNIKRC